MSISPGQTITPAGISTTRMPASTGMSRPTRAIRSPSISTSKYAVAAVRRIDDPPALKQPLHLPLRPPADRARPCARRRRWPPVRGSPSSGPSATSDAISTPRFIGPGCMMMTSGLARFTRSAVMPNTVKYSRSDGKNAPLHPFLLNAQHHDDVGVRDRFVHRRRDADAQPLDAAAAPSSAARTARRRRPAWSAAARSIAARGCAAGRRRSSP